MYGIIAGRFGFAADNGLLYGKLGGIFTSVKSSFIDSDPAGTTLVSGTDTKNRNGWVLGAGMEYALNRNWAARIEYNHYDFGTARHTATNNFGVPFAFDEALTADSLRVGITYLIR